MSPRANQVLGWAIILVWAIVMAQMLWGKWALDLTALYFAAEFFASGQTDMVYLPGPEVFVVDPPEAWTALARAEGRADAQLTPYLYPPLWAALLAPIAARVSAIGFFNAMILVNLASIAGMIWVSYRFARPKRLGFGLWAALSVALVATSGVGEMGLWLGQPQIVVSFVTLLSAYALARGRDLGAGAALGLAAAMKLTPAILVILFVMERRWRALGAFAVTGAAFGLASIAIAGWPLHRAFLHKLAEVEAQVLISRIVAGIEMFLYQIGAMIDGSAVWRIDTPWMVPEPGWIGWVVRAVLGVGLWLTWATTRRLPKRRRIWTRFFALLLVTLVTNPLAWIHYLILPLLLLPGLVTLMPARRAYAVIAAVGAAMSLPVFLWLSDQTWLGFVQAGVPLGVALGLFALLMSRGGRAARRVG